MKISDHANIILSFFFIMCRVIENDYLGLRNGILDQSAILLSSYGCLLCMNCKVLHKCACLDIVEPILNFTFFMLLLYFFPSVSQIVCCLQMKL